MPDKRDPETKYIRKKLWEPVTKAIKDFSLIKDGDNIGVGLSGGKDSSLLLFVLASLKERAPVSFTVHGLHIDAGWDMDMDPIKRFCEKLKVPYQEMNVPIKEAVLERDPGTSACSLCARLRRGSLDNLAIRHGCNKIALGHHADDALETLFLCMMFEGRLATMKPMIYLDRTDITLIRPLILTTEETVIRSKPYYDIPTVINPCPIDKKTKREEVKKLIADMEQRNPGIKTRLFASLRNVDLDNLWVDTSHS